MTPECNIKKMIAGLNGIVGSTAVQTAANNTPVCQRPYLNDGKVAGNTFSIGDECPETSNNLGYANYQAAKNFNDNYGQCTAVLNKSGFPVQIAKIKLEPPTIKRAEISIWDPLEYIWDHSPILVKAALVGIGALLVAGATVYFEAVAVFTVGVGALALVDIMLGSPVNNWWDNH